MGVVGAAKRSDTLYRFFLILSLLFGSISSFATTYFVSKSGSDSNACTSGATCLTIGHAIGLTVAGDTVSIHAGIYREILNFFSKSGASGSPITLTAFGDGAVTVDGSPAVTGWALDSGNVYKATPGFIPRNVIVDNTVLTEAAQMGDTRARSAITIGAGQWFYDQTAAVLYVQTAAGDTPANHDVIVLQCQRNNCGVGNPDNFNTFFAGNFWDIESITFRGSGNFGIKLGSNITFNNSASQFNYWGGTQFGANSTITNNVVDWNMMGNFPRGICNNFEPVQATYNQIGRPGVDTNGTVISVANGGTGYTVGDVVTIVEAADSTLTTYGLTPTGGTATVSTISGGGSTGPVTALTVTTGANGHHYYVATGLSTTGGTGSGLTVNLNHLASYPSCFIFGGWAGGLDYDHDSTVTGNTVYDNGGEGLISFCGGSTCPGTLTDVHNNVVYSNWSEQMYVDNQQFYNLHSNLVYCEEPSNHPEWTLNSGSANEGFDIQKRLRGIGMHITDEFYTGTGHSNHDQFYDNVVVNCRFGVIYNAQENSSGFINDAFIHNTLVNPVADGRTVLGDDNVYSCISVAGASSGATSTGSIIRDNICYGQGTTNTCIQTYDTKFTGITIDHNLCFAPNVTSPFQSCCNASYYTNATWESNVLGPLSQGGGDVNGSDPQLVNPTTFIASDKQLSTAASPAFHAGTATAFSTDYNGKAFNSSMPTMGAFEFLGASFIQNGTKLTNTTIK